jgi:cytochrome c biogenesis protein CcdA/thiol-disulfide isomerase/thioredoxin
MNVDLLTIVLGFLEGFALILSPCILSILPIILAGSLTGSKKKPLGIIVGFSTAFALTAFFARGLVEWTGIDLNLIRHVAFVFLFLMGVVLLSNRLTILMSRITERFSAMGRFCSITMGTSQGFFSGIIMGALVAFIWTPCAGPILAAIIVQIAIQKSSWGSFLTLLAFALGAILPMIIIVFYGLKIKSTFIFFKKRAQLFRQALGTILILTLLYLVSQDAGYLVQDKVPLTQVRTANTLESGLWVPYPAPKITGIEAWINSPPVDISSLKGKVVLVDFWTYSCINCLRTLPYLKSLYQQYHDKGLVIIGVHAPEFDFEKKLSNVEQAVKRDGILYPVALDNQFVTWRNYRNHYWPAHYLINKVGEVVYEHFGEGDYDVIQNNIAYLLGLGRSVLPSEEVSLGNDFFITPETYLGYARGESNFNTALSHDVDKTYHFPGKLTRNGWALEGGWQVLPDRIVTTRDLASLKIAFSARHVYMVIGNSTGKPVEVKLRLNGQALSKHQGADVHGDSIRVDRHALYEVLDLPGLEQGILEVISSMPGIEFYTFTFGG